MAALMVLTCGGAVFAQEPAGSAAQANNPLANMTAFNIQVTTLVS